MKLEEISHSRLELFRQCQFKYKLKYHDCIEPPIKPDYFEFGKFMHRILELNVKNNISLGEAYEIALTEGFEFGKDKKEKIPRMLKNFTNFEEHSKEELKEEFVEDPFLIPLTDGLKFKGVVDRIMKYNSGQILIIDYKTTKPYSEVKQYEAQENKQLLTYMWAIHKKYDFEYQNINAMLFYLDSGRKVIAKPNAHRIKLYLMECVDTAANIKNLDPQYAKPNVTKLCNYCEYRSICPHFKS